MKIQKKLILLALAILALPLSAQAKSTKNNKVFFRGGLSSLTGNRGGEVFTDTLSTTTTNNGKLGFNVAAGLDLGMMDRNSLFDAASLAGEVMIEFSRFSANQVTQTTSALLGGVTTSKVAITELNVGINPKLKIDKFGSVRPFIIPVGLAFLVSSPPSNDSTYLDFGLNFAAGVDFELTERLSLGVDARYTHGFEINNTKTSYFSTGASLGILF